MGGLEEMRNEKERLDTTQIERIHSVLYTFFTDPTYLPSESLDFQEDRELNPTRDRLKFRILKLDRIVSWRLKVCKAFNCNARRGEQCRQLEGMGEQARLITEPLCCRIYPYERRFRRRYLSRPECWAWWHYYWTGAEGEGLGDAVRKISNNLDRWRIWVE